MRVVAVRAGVQFFADHAWLDTGVVLIFVTAVFGDVSTDFMKEDLADRYVWIDFLS